MVRIMCELSWTSHSRRDTPFFPYASTAMKKRRRLSTGGGSRLVACPACGKTQHQLLLNDHLEACVGRELLPQQLALPQLPPAPPPQLLLSETPPPQLLLSETLHPRDIGADMPLTPPPPPPPPPPPLSADGATALVHCPVCCKQLRNDEVFTHLDVCTGSSGGSSSSDNSSTVATTSAGSAAAAGSAAGDDADVIVRCPVCDFRCLMSALNDHLDNDCPADEGGAGGEDGQGAAASSAAAGTAPDTTRFDRLAAEMKCSLCFDLFDDPHSLPCQHSFCRECIIACFKATSNMACPLCKAPAWMRQVAPNHTLAGIVHAFKEVSG
jgi:hypothetical protein